MSSAKMNLIALTIGFSVKPYHKKVKYMLHVVKPKKGFLLCSLSLVLSSEILMNLLDLFVLQMHLFVNLFVPLSLSLTCDASCFLPIQLHLLVPLY